LIKSQHKPRQGGIRPSSEEALHVDAFLPAEISDAAPAGAGGSSTCSLTHGWLAVGYMTAPAARA